MLDDPLSDNSKGYGWGSGKCQFTGGAYHVKSQTQSYFTLCYAQGTDYSNFAFQVQMTILAGDSGGIVFRADGVNNRYYLFHIFSSGFYAFDLYVGSIASHTRTLASGSSSAISTSLNQPNLITVVARGSSIDLFVNQQYVTGGSDSTYSHGQIGVIASDYFGNSTEVVYSNAKVWTL